MFQCASSLTMALHKVGNAADSFSVSGQFYRLEGLNDDAASITPFDDKLSTVHFTKNYNWPPDQSNNALKFIDTLRIISFNSSASPIVIRQDRDIFYEIHADEDFAVSYEKHIVAKHLTVGP